MTTALTATHEAWALDGDVGELGELRLDRGELRLHLRLRCEGRDGIRKIGLRRELPSDRVVERVAKIRSSCGRERHLEHPRYSFVSNGPCSLGCTFQQSSSPAVQRLLQS